MTGVGTVIMDQSAYGSYVLKGGYALTSGALVFATATAANNVFNGFTGSAGICDYWRLT